MPKTDGQFNWPICGHKRITDFLQLAIANNNLAQAYLFAGPPNLGKYALAQIFAQSILCEKKLDAIPCGACSHCEQFLRHTHADVSVVERQKDEKTEKLKRDITIDQVRDLKNRLQQSTLLNNYKIAIIPGAQDINASAYNALLKLLEEPTPKTVIILICDDIGSLPETIISRCQIMRFQPVAAKEIESRLKFFGVTPEEAKILAHLSLGRPGLAVSLYQDSELKKNYETEVRDFFQAANLNLGGRLALVDDLIGWDKDEMANVARTENLLARWQTILRDLALVNNNNEPLVANLPYLNLFKSESDKFPFKKIINLLALVKEAQTNLKRNINSKFVLENLIINL